MSNNYVRGGGDGYRMFADARDVYDFGLIWQMLSLAI